MSNNASFLINNPQSGNHQVFMEQDAGMPTTINALVDGHPTPCTSCSASENGRTLKGTARISVIAWVAFNDAFVLTVGHGTTTLMVQGYGTMSGAITAAQEAELVAFITTCKLPPLAE